MHGCQKVLENITRGYGITRKILNLSLVGRGLRPLVITITTRNIFQYFLTAMHDSSTPSEM